MPQLGANGADRVLVTGATGLLGANLMLELERCGMQVKVLTRDAAKIRLLRTVPGARDAFTKAEIVEGDIRDASVRERAAEGVDVIFHALHSHEYWLANSEIYEVNVAAPLELIRHAHSMNPAIRVVFTSSVSTLAAAAPHYQSGETDSIPRREFSSLTKAWAERSLEQLRQDAGVDVVFVHTPYMFGPNDLQPTPLALVIPAARFFVLPFSPAGGETLVHADRVVAAHLQAMTEAVPGQHVVVQGTNMTLARWILSSNRAAGHDVEPTVVDEKLVGLFARGRVFDSWCALRMSRPNYSPSGTDPQAADLETMDEAVLRVSEWYEHHPSWKRLEDLLQYAWKFI